MSHFTVLVIGDDPERQLAPYHEFECTGENDEYVQDIDITEEYRAYFGSYLKSCEEKGENPTKSFATYCSEDYAAILPGQEPDIGSTHKYGFTRLDEQKNVISVIRRTNPDKKWDWYVLGGRWTGFFTLKTGTGGKVGRPGIMTSPAAPGKADQARKGDIDFEGMRRTAEEEAAKRYDAVRAVIGPHLPAEAWDQVRRKYRAEECGGVPLPGGIDAAREAYHGQPAVQAFNASEFGGPFSDIEPYLKDRESYIRDAGTGTYMTFAVVKDGKWHERGSMGWWGIVTDEKEGDAWATEFAKLIDGLPDDTLLSVYDCHI